MKPGKSETNGRLSSGLNPEITCPFCDGLEEHRILEKTGLVLAMTDGFPVSPGHTLIIPRRHCMDYFLLTPEEQAACWDLVNKMKHIIDRRYHPDGYNIGINNLQAAGQTIPHVHIHLIPRYHGDVARPQGGVRGVIPAMKEY
jgi:diadenosine tetraphosphate (Ap4A) HIT family hydrolase